MIEGVEYGGVQQSRHGDVQNIQRAVPKFGRMLSRQGCRSRKDFRRKRVNAEKTGRYVSMEGV